jgi:integrase
MSMIVQRDNAIVNRLMSTVDAVHAPTLAELIARVDGDADLAPWRRRDLLSSLRGFARCVGDVPTAIPTDVGSLRLLIGRAHPASCGFSAKRWGNIRSGLSFVLKRYQDGRPRQWQAWQLEGRWRELRDAISNDCVRIGLSRFFRFLSGAEIEPEAVDAATFVTFRAWLVSETLCANPAAVHRRSLALWNRAAEAGAPWLQVDLELPSRTRTFVLPLATFPASFTADLEAWRAVVSGADLLHDCAPPRPRRPRTVEHEVMVLRRFASALVHKGVDPATIRTLGDLVQPERFKLALRYFLDRHSGAIPPSLGLMAGIVITVARHWLRVDRQALDELRRLAVRVSSLQPGLTPENRRRLTQFDDPRNVIQLFALPDRLVEAAAVLGDELRAALTVQMALAISILLAAPLRLHNLAGLDPGRHVVRTGRGRRQEVRLSIEREETKNRQVLDYPLPDPTVAILDLYLARYLPLLDAGGPWLFPGRDGRAKDANLLSEQIQATIRRETGLVMHVHLFRHLAGKLSLRMDPGNYEQVRRLLGHRTIDTTTIFYTGFTTELAARRYHEQVLLTPTPKPRPRGRRRESR